MECHVVHIIQSTCDLVAVAQLSGSFIHARNSPLLCQSPHNYDYGYSEFESGGPR